VLATDLPVNLADNAEVRPYGAFFEVLQGPGDAFGLSVDTVRPRAVWGLWHETLTPEPTQPALISNKASFALPSVLPAGAAQRGAADAAPKALKNSNELAGLGAAHARRRRQRRVLMNDSISLSGAGVTWPFGN
jgi:hypothetical protein